jgi:hypothetical protein
MKQHGLKKLKHCGARFTPEWHQFYRLHHTTNVVLYQLEQPDAKTKIVLLLAERWATIVENVQYSSFCCVSKYGAYLSYLCTIYTSHIRRKEIISPLTMPRLSGSEWTRFGRSLVWIWQRSQHVIGMNPVVPSGTEWTMR